jgi:hypothetical protein
MLINFLGAPCSGKTTSAARVFADLKDEGYPAEFVSEAARRFIAARPHPVTLTAQDQIDIMMSQWENERVMSQGDSLVICDSSIINGLLYMPEEARQSVSVQSAVAWARKNYGVVFTCQTIQAEGFHKDPNRVHSFEESIRLELQLPILLEEFAPEIKPVHLFGTSKYRTQEALRAIYSHIYGHGYGPNHNT